MEKQIKDLASTGMISTFVGMLTDSRSFLSFTRHEYFRRILCNYFGELVTSGEFPEDYKARGSNEPKTAIEDLGALMEKAIKLLQGDKPFPDTFAHDDAVAVIKGFQKTFC